MTLIKNGRRRRHDVWTRSLKFLLIESIIIFSFFFGGNSLKNERSWSFTIIGTSFTCLEGDNDTRQNCPQLFFRSLSNQHKNDRIYDHFRPLYSIY